MNNTILESAAKTQRSYLCHKLQNDDFISTSRTLNNDAIIPY